MLEILKKLLVQLDEDFEYYDGHALFMCPNVDRTDYVEFKEYLFSNVEEEIRIINGKSIKYKDTKRDGIIWNGNNYDARKAWLLKHIEILT